ncbi:MAG: hypothetical protein ACPK85_16555 [Methanosarcina sp.]
MGAILDWEIEHKGLEGVWMLRNSWPGRISQAHYRYFNARIQEKIGTQPYLDWLDPYRIAIEDLRVPNGKNFFLELSKS